MAVDQYQVMLAALREISSIHDKDSRNDELAEAISTLIDVKIAAHLDAAYRRGLYDGHNGGYPGGTTKTLANLKE